MTENQSKRTAFVVTPEAYDDGYIAGHRDGVADARTDAVSARGAGYLEGVRDERARLVKIVARLKDAGIVVSSGLLEGYANSVCQGGAE